MPELPEVEHLRRTLEPVLRGAVLSHVRLVRPEIARHASRRELLDGATVVELRRHGKQLALVGDRGTALCVQLGMTGQLRWVGNGSSSVPHDHVHCRWRVTRCGTVGRLLFRDPRRFGGLSPVPNPNALARRWAALGPDALTISARTLRSRISGRRRPVKSALLDQAIIAGLGNIYVDECLHRARIHPQSTCDRIPAERVTVLGSAIRSILSRAITAGGTTLRDYVDADGAQGRFRARHHVYGRAGEPCRRCRASIRTVPLVQRTTAYCAGCQRRY